MQPDCRISTPVLLVGMAGIGITLFVLWFGLRSRDHSDGAPGQSESTPSTLASAAALESRDISDATSGAGLLEKDSLAVIPDAFPEPSGWMEVFVQDPAGFPVVNAQVRLSLNKTESVAHPFTQSTNTDSAGRADMPLPWEPMTRVELRAEHEDLGGRKMTWDLRGGDVLPASYTFRLGNATSIGGTIVDEADSPVVGAELRLHRFWTGDDRIGQNGEEADFAHHTVSTDASGRWHAKGLPAELLPRIACIVSHPDFVQTRFTPGEKPDAEARLRAGTHRLVLKGGLIVRGRVLDEYDSPIPNAKVWAGMVNYLGTQTANTDGAGVFVFCNLKEGELPFSVLAKGHKPEARKVSIIPGMDEIIFKLGPGRVIRGIVINEAGEPLPGVRIALEDASGGFAADYVYEMETDDSGRFAWDGAPDEPRNFHFFKAGYEVRSRQTLSPHEENVVTLRKGRKVQGWVVDAETEQPVTQFRLGVGRLGSADAFYADHPGLRTFTDPNGRFELVISDAEQNGITAEADDYAGQTLRLPVAEDGVVRVVFRLTPGATVRAVLVTMDGTPVPGAGVALTSDSGRPGSQSVSFRNGRLISQGSASKIVRTDTSGQFVLPSPPEAGGLVVAAADYGFAMAPAPQVRASGHLVLQPYGRVEGTFTLGGQPVPGQLFMFSLSKSGITMDWASYRTPTDEQGRFQFERIPAGEGEIVRLVPFGKATWIHSHSTRVVVTPGQTTQVTLGESGALLTGTVTLESVPAEIEKLSLSAHLVEKLPDRPPTMDSSAAQRAFYDSPEWKNDLRNRRSFLVAVNPDGSFKLDSIPPGVYELLVIASKAGDQAWTAQLSEPVAQGRTTVTVPENANSYTPIRLDPIILKPFAKPGQPPF